MFLVRMHAVMNSSALNCNMDEMYGLEHFNISETLYSNTNVFSIAITVFSLGVISAYYVPPLYLFFFIGTCLFFVSCSLISKNVIWTFSATHHFVSVKTYPT